MASNSTRRSRRSGSIYRSRGFAWVDVKIVVTEIGLSGEGRVRPSIAIAEGPRALIGEVTIDRR